MRVGFEFGVGDWVGGLKFRVGICVGIGAESSEAGGSPSALVPHRGPSGYKPHTSFTNESSFMMIPCTV